jgi:hypothetical protein
MRVAWTRALEINVIYRGVETMLHLSLKLKGPTIIALRSSKFLGTLTKVIRQTSSSVCTRWVAYGCEKKPKDKRVIQKSRKYSCGLMDNNKTFVKKYVITLAVGNFLKGSGLLLALDPISRVANHCEFLGATRKGETSVAGRDAFFLVANDS